MISSRRSGPPLDPLRLCAFALPLCFWPLCVGGDQKETQRRKGAKRWSPIRSGSPRLGWDRARPPSGLWPIAQEAGVARITWSGRHHVVAPRATARASPRRQALPGRGLAGDERRLRQVNPGVDPTSLVGRLIRMPGRRIENAVAPLSGGGHAEGDGATGLAGCRTAPWGGPRGSGCRRPEETPETCHRAMAGPRSPLGQSRGQAAAR